MKLLVLSHSCVIDLNQLLYLEMVREKDVEIKILIPNKWYNEYNKKLIIPKKLNPEDLLVYQLPVALPGNNSFYFFLQMPLIELRRFKPDIIFIDAEPWSVVMLQGIVLSWVLRSKMVFYTKMNLIRTEPFPFSWINKLALRKAQRIFVCAQEVGKVMRLRGYKGKIDYLPHGFDETKFNDTKDVSNLRTELGLNNAFVIGYMGRFVEEKGLNYLIEAAALISKEKLSNWKLVLIGNGSSKPYLEDLVKRLKLEDKVFFIDFVPHSKAGDYMSCLDLFVLPSITTPRWKEQFGRVIIEALACGVPVIGSNSGEIPNLINLTSGGLVVKEGNVVDLANSITELINDKSKYVSLASNGKKIVHSEFTNRAIAKKLISQLEDSVEN